MEGTDVSHFDSASIIPFWLDGKEVTTTNTFEVTSPVDHKVLYKTSSASTHDAQAALDAAQKAFKGWSKAKPAIRRDIFLKAGGIMSSRKEELWQYSQRETGAERGVFEFEFGLAVETFKAVAGLISTVHGAVIEPAAEDSSALMLREPWGQFVPCILNDALGFDLSNSNTQSEGLS
jgi:acyl-CoA reductase-like NAD-dependent aldehyde dehydrogenase